MFSTLYKCLTVNYMGNISNSLSLKMIDIMAVKKYDDVMIIYSKEIGEKTKRSEI